MPQCRCKMCGGIINYNNDQKVAVCEFCDTEQTIVNGDNEIKINLFNRANSLRLNNEFDKALATYENILKDYPNDAEAHWGICLCRYGIEYVDDPATHKKIPTCHRTLFNSIFDDIDYQEAINNSDVVARNLYIKEAEQIDKIQKTILSISQKEEPYDIFICYKETDKNGNRTKDSVIAQEIYTELVNKGYKVFFARITLESKLGSEYEPIIFAALQSSKVMLVVGTKEEYFNAPWVKNEWSRFLEFMKGRRGKYLIPCYKDMEAYDMPDEFLPLQSQSVDKLGFLQDLIRGINKIFDREEKPKIETNNTNVDPKINNLIKRIKLCIEDKDYNKANELIEEVLNIDVECVDAYVALLLMDLNLSNELELTNLYTPLDTNKNYIKALRFASSSYKKVLEGYNESIKNNILERRNNNIYNEAMSFYKNGQYDLAISKFKLILDYKDSKELITKINEEKEIQRKDEIYKTNISYIKGLFNIPNLSDQRNKLELYINNLKTIIDYKDTKELIEKFTQEFNDKCEQLELERKERIYNDALTFYKNKQYDAAISKLKEILDYKDSKELITKIEEEKEEARKNKIYEENVSKLKDITSTIVDNKTTLDMCINNLLQIEDYKDTKDIIEKYSKLYISEVARREEERKERIYNEALAFYNEKKYDAAINKLKEILDYKDSKELITKFEEEKKEYIYSNLISRFDTFLAKEGNINKNEFNKLIDELNTFINYKDTKELIEKYTKEFNVKVEKEKEVRREKKDKIIKYSKIGGPIFLGVLTILLLTIFLFVPLGKYNNAMELIDNKQYDEAKEILKDLDSFKDAQNQIELVNARECFDNLDYETGIEYVLNVNGQVEVNYDTDGGETLVTNEIIKKSKYINNDSNKTGYTFYGWSLKSYELDNKEYYATLNLKADYKLTEYNLTFNLDGGTFKSDVPSTYTLLDEVKIPNPSKVGYEFIGWTGLGLEEPTLDLVIPKGSVGNKEYTANYKIMYYAITYYLNEGTMLTAENPKTYTVEDEITLINPIKEGYKFVGWVGTDLSEPTLNVTISKGSIGYREYYAIWEVEEYTIIYNLNGGTLVNSNPISYNIYTETFSLKLPTKEGYEFIGWTGTGLSEPTLCVTVRKGSTGDREYTANWEVEKYTITYNLNGGTLVNSNPISYNIETETFMLNNPTKKGYKFVGWTGTGLSSVTKTVTITKGSTGDREYTANWEVEEYTITYNLNGGTLSKSNPSGYDINTTTFTLNNPTKEEYEFIGWTGTGLSSVTKTVTITKGSTGDREYTANWKPKEYIITYNLGGNDVINENPTTYTEFTETFVLNNPIRDGYKFIGWTSDGINNPIMVVEIPKGSTGNKEYTANWESEGLLYELNDDGASYTVYRGEYNKSEVIIPAYYEGLPVTSIGEDAFYNFRKLTSVVIPERVTSIGKSAFWFCYSLTSVVIPEGVTSIGFSAFSYCDKLTSIELPSTLTSIGSDAFSRCDNLTSVVIPGGVTSIGSDAFEGCNKLTSIIVNENNQKYKSIDGNLYNKEGTKLIQYAIGKIEENFVVPEGVTSIGSSAFYSCDNLTSVVIPEGVTSIGKSAFSYCGKLTSIELPSTLTSIGSSAFENCDSLTSIIVNENNQKYKSVDGNLYNKEGTELIQYAIGKIEENFVVPEGVTSIGSYAFSYCDNLTSVVIPSTLTSIGSYAFQWCDSLTSVVIPEGVTSIGSYAFSYCDKLTSIELPSTLTSIGSYAFYNCDSLTSVVIPGGVTSIGSYAFQGCNILTSVVILGGVTSIGKSAFSSCGKLTSIELPSTLTSIGSSAFEDCQSLESVVIPEGVTSIGSSTFSHCDNLTIYCEVSSQPSGWNLNWNYSNRPVYWASEWEYVDGVPTPKE